MRTNAGQSGDWRGRAAALAAEVNASMTAQADVAAERRSRRTDPPTEVPADARPPHSFGHPVSRRSGPEPTDAERIADALAVISRWRQNGWQ